LATYRYLCPGPRGEVRQRPLEFLELSVEGLPNSLEGLVLTADLQGRELAPPRRLFGEELADTLEVARPEAVGAILAGDFYSNEAADKLGVTGEVGPVWRAFGQRFRWVAGVLGNHDRLAEPAEQNARLLDGQVVELDGLRIAGISGIIGKAGRRGRRGLQAYLDLVDQLLAQRPDLLVLHEAPAQPPDLRGREELSLHLAQGLELLVVCGHCHWSRPWAQLGASVQVLNVDARAVLLRRSSQPCCSST
jgi:hypothetical protein